MIVSLGAVAWSPKIAPLVRLGATDVDSNTYVVKELLRQHKILFWIFAFLLAVTCLAFAFTVIEYLRNENMSRIGIFASVSEAGLLWYVGRQWHKSYENLKSIMK